MEFFYPLSLSLSLGAIIFTFKLISGILACKLPGEIWKNPSIQMIMEEQSLQLKTNSQFDEIDS